MIRMILKYKSQAVLLSMILIIILCILVPNIFNSLHFLGELFINILKVFALPLIFSALIATLGDMSTQLSTLKNIARNIISYMLLSEVIVVSLPWCYLIYLKLELF